MDHGPAAGGSRPWYLCSLDVKPTEVHQKRIRQLQGVQQNCLHLVICSFIGFYSCKMQKLGRFLKIWEIGYMIGTRILKFDSEIAEIIEVKVATFNMEIIFLPL